MKLIKTVSKKSGNIYVMLRFSCSKKAFLWGDEALEFVSFVFGIPLENLNKLDDGVYDVDSLLDIKILS